MWIDRAYWVVKIEKNWHATFSTFACDRLKRPRFAREACFVGKCSIIIMKTKIA